MRVACDVYIYIYIYMHQPILTTHLVLLHRVYSVVLAAGTELNDDVVVVVG